MFRTFLRNLHIVGCVGVWSEGQALHYTFDNLLRWCDKIVVLLDKPNTETEGYVKMYKDKYPDIFRIEFSKVPPLRDPSHVRRRTKVFASQLGEEKLALVKQIHNERPVDILLSLDSDEVFTDGLPLLLEKFWNSSFDSICMKPITIYDVPYIVHEKGMASHWRVYKYRPDMHYTPWRYRDFFHPFLEKNTMYVPIGSFVHLNYLAENRERKIRIGNPSLSEVCPDTKLWKINKDAWELDNKEYLEIINRPPDYLIKDYEKLSNRT